MKLKYYLRGMGIGIILTAIVMGFALGGRKATLSDAEIIQRAKVLGMVEAGNGVLTQTAEEVDSSNENDTSASDTTLDQEGSPVFEEVQQEVSGTDTSVYEVAREEEERKSDSGASVDDASSRQTETEDRSAVDSTRDESSSVASAEASEESSVITAIANASTEEASDSASEQESTESATTESSAESAAAASTSTTPSVPSKTVTIPGGMGSDQVAQILYKEGIVDNASTFNRYLIDRGLDRIIRSGEKTFPEGASYDQIAGIITKG